MLVNEEERKIEDEEKRKGERRGEETNKYKFAVL